MTPSDLNKLPVRVVAFTMLAHLEAIAMAAIDRLCESDREAIALLGSDDEAQILSEWRRFSSQRLEVSLLGITTLVQKGRILAALDVFDSKDESQGTLGASTTD